MLLKINVNHNIFYLGKILNFTLRKILKIFPKKTLISLNLQLNLKH